MHNENDKPVKWTKQLAFIPDIKKNHTGIYSNYS